MRARLRAERNARTLALLRPVELEELALLELEGGRDKVRREALDGGVEVADDGVGVPARVLNRPLDLAEVRLELLEGSVGLQLPVGLGHREEGRRARGR